MTEDDPHQSTVIEIDRASARARVEEFARSELGVSAMDACMMLDRGDLDGTIAELELRMLLFLGGRPEE